MRTTMRTMAMLLLGSVVMVGCAVAEPENGAGTGGTGGSGSGSGSGSAGSGSGSGSGACTVMTTELVQNGAFDASPLGMAWNTTPANAMYPVITSHGVTPQSAPDQAWMGSFVNSSDDMHEDLAIPQSTTMLVLSGYYEVRTSDTSTSPVDTGTVALVDPNTGDSLEDVLSLDNTQATTSWQTFNHTFTAPTAGMTVRLQFQTQNNATGPTSFYFDTLSLQATYCQ